MKKRNLIRIKRSLTGFFALSLSVFAIGQSSLSPIVIAGNAYDAGAVQSKTGSESESYNPGSDDPDMPVVTGFDGLPDSFGNITIYDRIPEAELKDFFPDSLTAHFSDGSSREINVTWEATADYSAGDEYYYVYNPVMEGVEITSGVEAPYIVVWVEVPAPKADPSEMLYAPAEPQETGEGSNGTDTNAGGEGSNGTDTNAGEEGGNGSDTNADGEGSNGTDMNTDGEESNGTDTNAGEEGGNGSDTNADGEGGNGTDTNAGEGGSKETDTNAGEEGGNGTDTNAGEGGSNGTDTNEGEGGSNGTDTNNTDTKENENSEGSGDDKDGNTEEGENTEDENGKESVLDPNKTNEENVFDYFVRYVGLNEAGACGVIANIKAESGFNPNALGDKINGVYTSYGICQWHNSRWNNLKTFCQVYEEDWESLEGQLKFLQYELEHNYKHVLKALKEVDNTPEGAYEAGYVFCAKFEIPANTEVKADGRGKVARDTYWPRYGKDAGDDNDKDADGRDGDKSENKDGKKTSAGPTVLEWKNEDGKNYWYEDGVRQGTLDDAQGVIGDGTVRGREIYDPVSDGWYWLDAAYNGAKAVNKEVWIPYIFNGEEKWDDTEAVRRAMECGGMAAQILAAVHAHGTEEAGKWVRYDANGKMVKGWYTVEGDDAKLYPDQAGNTYYYDQVTGLMAKGFAVIDGVEYYFDEVTGKCKKTY